MKIVLKWFIFGLMVFLIALIYTIPAHLIFPHLPSKVHISRLNGTLWNAHATDFSVNDFFLSRINWRIQPLYLLTGRLKTRVDFSHSDMSGSGDIILGYRSLSLENFSVTGNSSIIDPYINKLGASIDGKFDLSLESLDISHPGPQNAQGRLVVFDTHISSPADLSLGNIELDLEQKGDSVVAKLINSDSNTLKLSGSAKINPQWRYSSDIRISPTRTTQDALRQTLTLLGRVDARGAVTVQHQGKIPLLEWLPHLKENGTSGSIK